MAKRASSKSKAQVESVNILSVILGVILEVIIDGVFTLVKKSSNSLSLLNSLVR